MLVQTRGAPHYARGVSPRVSAVENADRLAHEHILKFWPGPITEGRATVQGHPIDADEEDPFEEMDIVDQYEPEAQGGRVLAQHREFLHQEVEFESPCVTCSNVWCSPTLEGMCRGEFEEVTERHIP